MIVKDIMTKDVVTIEKDKSVLEAATRMTENHISDLVVMKGDEITGIITLIDLVSKVIVKKRDVEEVTVDMVMTTPVKTIDLNDDISVAAEAMKEKNIKQLPITENGKLAGIVTQTDLVKKVGYVFSEC